MVSSVHVLLSLWFKPESKRHNHLDPAYGSYEDTTTEIVQLRSRYMTCTFALAQYQDVCSRHPELVGGDDENPHAYTPTQQDGGAAKAGSKAKATESS